MNKYSNGQTTTTVPTYTNDFWVFDVTNCSTAYHPYIASTTSGVTFGSNGSTCIPFN